MKRISSIFYKYIQKLDEDLKMSDLTRHAAISDLTSEFMKTRRGIKGPGNVSAQLIDCVINKEENWVEFQYRSGATHPDEEHSKLSTPDLGLKKNPSGVYIQRLRILDFFDWLDVFEGEIITPDEIKEILDVSNIKVFCSCPSYQYQGFNYYISDVFDGSVYPTSIPATDRKNDNGTVIGWKSRHGSGDGLICKHLDLIMAAIAFWRNNMASMLTKKLKDRNYI